MNTGLAPTTGVSQPTGGGSKGVGSTRVVDLTNEPDDNNVTDTIQLTKLEVKDIPTEEVIEEEETAQADTQA